MATCMLISYGKAEYHKSIIKMYPSVEDPLGISSIGPGQTIHPSVTRFRAELNGLDYHVFLPSQNRRGLRGKQAATAMSYRQLCIFHLTGTALPT